LKSTQERKERNIDFFYKSIITLYFIMNAKDATLAFLIVFIFVIIIIYNITTSKLAYITNNWPEYRCNPIIMPFASYFGHNPSKNFNECIKGIQKSNMGEFLQPVNYAISLAGKTGSQVTESVQGVREFLNYLRNQLHVTIRKIFTVFLGIVQPIQIILVKFRDLTMRLLGAMAVMLYLVDGSNKTVISAWNSDAGGLVRTLCFHPKTQIKLNNGQMYSMKNIMLGDILENGSEVIGVLQLKGGAAYYKIWSKKLNNFIYVTGTHLIENPKTKKFIPVERMAEISKETTDFMSCLITDNHRIPVGEHTFWDWEDDVLPPYLNGEKTK